MIYIIYDNTGMHDVIINIQCIGVFDRWYMDSNVLYMIYTLYYMISMM